MCPPRTYVLCPNRNSGVLLEGALPHQWCLESLLEALGGSYDPGKLTYPVGRARWASVVLWSGGAVL